MKTILLMCVVLAGGVVRAEEADLTVADFPRHGGETDDGPRLQRAIDATGSERVLYVPKGVYLTTRTLWVTNGASLLLHKSATIRAMARMDHLIVFDMAATGCWGWKATMQKGLPYDQGFFLRGGHLDGNGLASCLLLNHYFHFTMRDTVFVNGFPYGLHVGPSGAELVANNLYIRTLKSGLAGNIGLFSEGHDSYYTDIVVIDCTTGFKTTHAANAFFHCHAWGGPVPPVAPGRYAEMLENSVCFDLGGWGNILRDCYADTALIGYRVSGWGHQIVGSWYLNAQMFGLKDVVAVKQEPGSYDLLVADCNFRGNGPGSKVYVGPGNVKWRDMTYRNFPDEAELPGELAAGRVCACATADEWEYANGTISFKSPAGEFKAKGSFKTLELPIPGRLVREKFPKAGPGEAVVVRVRATDEQTKKLEVVLMQSNDRTWGKIIDLTTDWREVRIPFSAFAFKGFGRVRQLPGERPDARKMSMARFVYGNWIAGETAGLSHGFEVSSLRLIGR